MIATFSDEVIAKEEEERVIQFASETLDILETLNENMDSLRKEKRVSADDFQKEYEQIYKSPGREGDYEILSRSSSYDDEPKLKRLRERIIQWPTEESFYDCQKVNQIIVLNRVLKHGDSSSLPEKQERRPPEPSSARTEVLPTAEPMPLEPERVFIKGGTFKMGIALGLVRRFLDEVGGGFVDDKREHEVTVSDFYIGKYEVTFAQYDAFCEATDKKKPDDGGMGRDNRPVMNISWYGSVAYCEWLSAQTGKKYRLPTEAEWEYACRAGTSTLYSWGDSEREEKDYAWCRTNSGWKTHEVGGKKPNAFGLYDMHGNVGEWCADWYETDYYKRSPRDNPKGPSSSDVRVVRGGIYFDYGSGLRSGTRDFFMPYESCNWYGLRVVRDP